MADVDQASESATAADESDRHRGVSIALAVAIATVLVGVALAYKLGNSKELTRASTNQTDWQGSEQLQDLMSQLCSPGSGLRCPAPRFTTEILFSNEGYVFGSGSDLSDVSTIAPGQELASLQQMEELKQVAPSGSYQVFYVRGPDWMVETRFLSAAQRVQEILGGELSSYRF